MNTWRGGTQPAAARLGAELGGDGWIERDEADPEKWVYSVPGSNVLIGDGSGGVDRDREANPLRLHTWLGLPRDQCIDANDLALEIRERAARIARVDRRIGLDRVEERGALCLRAALE